MAGSGGRPTLVDRWGRPIAIGLTLIFGIAASYRLILVGTSSWAQAWAFGNGDLVGYLDGARRFLDTGSPYLPEQVAGPWILGPHSFIHPPAALPLFVPFLILPAILWWAIPIAITVVALIRLRPAPWTWPLMALCLCWPRTTGAILAGNSDIWAVAILSVGAVISWPVALLIIKPTYAPLGLISVRDRSAWIAALAVGAISLLALSLWLDWIAVVQNAHLSFTYSLLNLPFLLIPVIAHLGRTRR